MKKLFLALATAVMAQGAMTAAAAAEAAERFEVTSPDKRYRVEVLGGDREVSYRVWFEDEMVVQESKLGVEVNNQYLQGATLVKQLTDKTVEQSWKPLYGERATVIDHYNSKVFEMQSVSNPRSKLNVEFRAYDQGVAFRYNFVGNSYLHITDEYTTFTLPEGTKAYHTPRTQTSFELLPLTDWPSESERPLVCQLPSGKYLLLTEAAMVDYVRTKYKLHPTEKSTLASSMYGAVDRIAPYSSPWRVIMGAQRAGELIENNDLILNLNPENAIEDASWIKPGKMFRETTLSTQGGMAAVDFCVERNMQYVLFDAGWYGPEGSHTSDATTITIDPARNKNNNTLELVDVIKYAKSKGVEVVLYINQRALFAQLDEMLPLYKEWGVAGLKFGFVQVGSQYWTEWMHEAVKKCAEYEMIVDIHDEYRPTGFSRTYPNLLTQEGIKGNEEFPDATHNVTLPFTRYTQGPADYTLCYFRRDWSGRSREQLVKSRLLTTTPVHQLAMAVVYYSPLQLLYWYDKPSDYKGEPEVEFWDKCPTVWEDTKVLAAEIGEYISIARKSGDEWFVGSMTNTEGRNIPLKLDFLDGDKKYMATIYYDDPKNTKTRTKVSTKRMRVSAKSLLNVEMLPDGGHAMIITPQ